MDEPLFSCVLPCAKGSEQVLQQEAEQLGVQTLSIAPAVVRGKASLLTFYRLCLWSRTASRVLLVLAHENVDSAEAIYEVARNIAWEDHIAPDDTFAVRFNGLGCGIRNTQFGALKIKDAVVDRLRDIVKRRPDVDAKTPDILLDAHLHKNELTLALDLSGGSLHERGYRQAHGAAPMKETLAATLLYRARWHEFCAQPATLIDPTCGAGTLVLEAAMMAADYAPNLQRQHWGFTRWQNHRPALWNKVIDEAQTRKNAGIVALSDYVFYGYDQNPAVIAAARANAKRLGLEDFVHFAPKRLEDLTADFGARGFVVANPPYGERLGEVQELIPTYAALGHWFKTLPADWEMAVIASNDALLKRMRLRAHKYYQAFNGTIAAQIVHYRRSEQPESQETAAQQKLAQASVGISEQAQMFANRLQKNIQKIRPSAERTQTDAYRIYDQDMPEYAVAIDCYGDAVVIQEYAPPKTIDPQKAQQRLFDVLQVVPEVLALDERSVFLKTRQRQTGKTQYNPAAEKRNEERIVCEGAARFLVNLSDYLDTGLFLDHRPMRRLLFEQAAGKRVLNLFCYTATASVQAALGGASYTTSVDLSPTYLDWAQRNFDLNALSDRHRLQRADVMAWLHSGKSQFDMIFCDPPTFSNTKKEQRVFDVQRDQIALIDGCMQRLAAGGILYFSNNYRGFRLEEALCARYCVQEISENTIDFDFKRRPKIHRVWKIMHRADSEQSAEK